VVAGGSFKREGGRREDNYRIRNAVCRNLELVEV
jgi:hypothetical protein